MEKLGKKTKLKVVYLPTSDRLLVYCSKRLLSWECEGHFQWNEPNFCDRRPWAIPSVVIGDF